MTFRDLRLALAPVAILSGGLLMVSNASASVINTLLTGSTGTVTVSLQSLLFNTDPEPGAGCQTTLLKGCNSDVTTFTNLTFTGGPLTTGEGVYVNNNDLTLSAPSASDANQFLTFAAHPNLVFSETSIGPGSTNTDCSLTSTNTSMACSVFAGSPIVLFYNNGHTVASIGIVGNASDTGVGGLAGGSSWSGGFSQTFTQLLPNGATPTPLNIQDYFCTVLNPGHGNSCSAADFTSGRSVTTSQEGSFTASSSVPEPSAVFLGSLGIAMLLVGARFRKSHGRRA